MQKIQITESEYRVGVINSIAKRYKQARQDAKAPTFALTYKGTYRTLMKNCGFSEEKAKYVEEQYHKLYCVSDAWVQRELDKAANTGYVVGAFGLKLRTPLLKQVILSHAKTVPYQALKTAKTAGNMLGQSWCLLNNRMCSAVMRKVRAHPEYRLKIRPCLTIHDATYFLVANEPEVVVFLNKIIVEESHWNDHPAIYHPIVGLGGELSLFVPNWSTEIVLPKDITVDELITLAESKGKIL